MPLYVQLPPNLCKEILHEGKSVYYRDYCSKYNNGKIPTKPSVPYTSLIERISKNKIMTDHFSALPIDHIQKSRYGNETNTGLKGDKSNNRRIKSAEPYQDSCFRKSASKTLENIEIACIKDVGTDKRNRGYIYGVAGKKMAVHHKDLVRKESVPGLKDWLDTSDEYEKKVVHKFLTNLTKADNEETPPTTPSHEAPQKTVRIHCPPKSGPPLLSRRATPKAAMQPHIQSMEECSVVGLEQNSRGSSRSSSKSYDAAIIDVFPQAPLDVNSKPTSSSKHQRSNTAPEVFHSCQHCEACKRKIYKRMLHDLERSHPKTYDELITEKSKEQKTTSTYLYRPVEDYTHCGTSFQRVNGRQKGYFVIHPDFVSENKSMAWQKWKTNKKYFGESKSII